MRDIKFRAWADKKMVDVLSIDFKLKDICVYRFHCDEKYFVVYDINNVNLMQYTGIKDKNGVEIYEGDIVKLSRFNNWLNEVVFDEENASFKLISVDKQFASSYFSNFEDKSKLVVVGNIYENPELLES